MDSDPSVLTRIWNEVVDVWLQSLQQILGAEYRVDRTENFAVLSALDVDDSPGFLRQLEADRSALLRLLAGAVDDAGYGPHVVLVFHSDEAYYHYVAPYYPEGDSGGSTGLFIGDSYRHIAICYRRQSSRPTLVHELTHCLLSHLPLPAWLNEGITQMAEVEVCESEYALPTPESLREQKTFWRENSLQDFWTGQAFFRPDDGQKFAYELADLLVRKLYAENRSKLRDVLNTADWRDAGEQALRNGYGLNLQGLIAGVFGAGDWQPRQPLFDDQDQWGTPA